jgi:lysylphosphatidylglycerol synthetase-like protein (DUF2156 family)
MATNPTRVERELVLLRIPSLPLAVAVGLVAVVFFSASALLGGSTALRQLEREVPLNEALWMTLAIPGIGALMGFAQGFLSTSISVWFLNLILHLLGGVRFVVGETAPTSTEPPTSK